MTTPPHHQNVSCFFLLSLRVLCYYGLVAISFFFFFFFKSILQAFNCTILFFLIIYTQASLSHPYSTQTSTRLVPCVCPSWRKIKTGGLPSPSNRSQTLVWWSDTLKFSICVVQKVKGEWCHQSRKKSALF